MAEINYTVEINTTPAYTIELNEKGARGSVGGIVIGDTITIDAGQPAVVENVGTPTQAILNFSIPKGYDGTGAGDMMVIVYDPDLRQESVAFSTDLIAHTTDTDNPHSVTATQVGLGNVANVDTTNADNISSGALDDARLSSNVTAQGNTFNGTSQLIQTTVDGKFPALDGSLITGISPYTADTSNMQTISNNATDVNNDIDFSAGHCYDLTTFIKITSTAKTKRLDATFAEGTNQGGLFSGTKAGSTTYHCFVISKADGTTDCGFSTSVTASDIPTGYVNKRRVGSIMTNASGNIIQFIQHGDDFYIAQTLAYNATSGIPTTPTTLVLPTPTGIRTKPLIYIVLNDTVGRSIVLGEVGSTTLTLPAIYCATTGYNAITGSFVYTNLSSSITHYKTAGTTATSYTIYLDGYIDARKGVN